jgi:hypothetical protein
MPSGDTQRTWFPEMIALLRSAWRGSPTQPELIALTERVDCLLQDIRRQRNILPPMMRCPRCKTRHRVAPPRVSVRAMLLAVERFGIAAPAEIRALEKDWKKYRVENGLDLYGKAVTEESPLAPCRNEP